jgi:hypothetical protein
MIINEIAENQNRQSKRQNVLLKSNVDIGSYYFDAITYDLSLYGAKIKLNLPLERGSTFIIEIKGSYKIPSKVSWAENGFIGLEFTYSPDLVKTIFGSLGDRLE